MIVNQISGRPPLKKIIDIGPYFCACNDTYTYVYLSSHPERPRPQEMMMEFSHDPIARGLLPTDGTLAAALVHAEAAIAIHAQMKKGA
jgi:hypothetical protein